MIDYDLGRLQMRKCILMTLELDVISFLTCYEIIDYFLYLIVI